MNIPPLSKTKEAFRAFIAALAAGEVPDVDPVAELDGFEFYRGARSGLQKIPSVCVSTLDFMPESTGPDSPLWHTTVILHVDTPATSDENGTRETSCDAHDAAVEALLRAFDVEKFVAFCNSENTDNRPELLQSGFHISEVNPPRGVQHYDPKMTSFCTVLTFSDVMVQDDDGDAPQ